MSIRDAQVAALNSLLAFNTTGPAHHGTGGLGSVQGSSNSSTLPTWKVMIMDKTAQDVVATSLRVQDLRDAGVTLHMCVRNMVLIWLLTH